ncbi:XrtA/PEP-CTERM system histidine kinase PrsK [Novosphingobium sp.]|uniref:XrtA/PEP-CTERM system histidine kinase PrsK n=1 Tax=Novosphingobium sp. TaxID=1874826 RepID=UPI00286BA856|nr:XrtA/PEP-CTERM system histidine kinase PrsK [Novosphingobium sp.]
MDALLLPDWSSINTVLWSAGAMACITAAAWLYTCKERFGPARSALVGALAATAGWALTGALTGPESHATGFAEVLRDLSWVFVVYRLFAADGRLAVIRPVRPLLAALCFVELAQAGLLVFLSTYPQQQLAFSLGFQTIIMLHLLGVIGGLVLLHNLYGGASGQARQIMRWPAMALTMVWGLDLNYYAIAYLVQGYPDLLEAVRGGLTIPLAAMLAFGAAGQGESPRLRPSRTVAFQTMSLILIGGYLVVMVAMAQWLAFAGNDYSRPLQIAFLTLASAVAAILLFSERLRSTLRVVTAKHLFQHRYDYRTEWLRFTRTIGQSGEGQASLEERVIRALADIVESPSGLLLIQADSGQLELAARWEWPTADVPSDALDQAAIRAIEAANYVADLDAVRAGKIDKRCSVVLPEWLLADPRAWALVPLLHYERLIGAVVLARPAHARLLDWEDFDLLRVAGQQLASYLAEHAGQAALAEASRFDDFHRRIAFVMHDIKNLASQMSLLARNAESHAENPEFRADMLVTLRNSADKLNALLARLSRYGASGAEAIEVVRADEVAAVVVGQLGRHHPVTLVEMEPIEVAATRHALEQVLLHLVQNAIEASPADAPVFVRVGKNAIHGEIEVLDSGTGMTPEFVRTRLFKPFDSTKSGGFGIGAYEARELVRAMGGRLEVESRESFGTRFIIRLPLSETAAVIEALAQHGTNKPKVA